MYALQKLQNEIEKQLQKVTGKKIKLMKPPKPEMGDFSFFSKEKISLPKIKGVKEIKVMGPYHNLFLDYDSFASDVFKESVKKTYGKGNQKNKMGPCHRRETYLQYGGAQA